MSKAKTVDLTSGPILKTLAELALPIMISSMLGTAYSIMDMAWIGLLGAKAVAGVGVGGMYVWLSQGLASLRRRILLSCYHFSSSVPHSTDLFGSVTLSAVTGGSCRSLAFTVCSVPVSVRCAAQKPSSPSVRFIPLSLPECSL